MTTPTSHIETGHYVGDMCGAGVWLLATAGASPLDEHHAYRTHCGAAPGHPGPHSVRVAGEADDSDVDVDVDPVTLTWSNASAAAATVIPVVGADGTPYLAVWSGCATDDGRRLEFPHTRQPGCRDLFELVTVTPGRTNPGGDDRHIREAGR